MMVPHILNKKGFTLVEMCIVLMIISLFTLFALPIKMNHFLDDYTWPIDYLEHQTESILQSKEIVFDSDHATIRFNEKGNVRNAQTIKIQNILVVSELGEGKLVFK